MGAKRAAAATRSHGATTDDRLAAMRVWVVTMATGIGHVRTGGLLVSGKAHSPRGSGSRFAEPIAAGARAADTADSEKHAVRAVRAPCGESSGAV